MIADKRNRIHVIGKDIAKFHLTHYIALALLLNVKLPKVILQHPLINALQTKVSKSLKNQPCEVNFPAHALQYYLRTRSLKIDTELTRPKLVAAFAKLTNNVGNLAKRIIRLLTLNRSKLRQLTVAE